MLLGGVAQAAETGGTRFGSVWFPRLAVRRPWGYIIDRGSKCGYAYGAVASTVASPVEEDGRTLKSPWMAIDWLGKSAL